MAKDKKRCSRCSRELDLDRFGKHANKKDGLESWCRECVLDARKKKAVNPRRHEASRADRDRRLKWKQRAEQLERRVELVDLGLENDDQLDLDYGDVL